MRTPIVRTTEDGSLTEAVVLGVAEARGVDPIALDQRLYEVIDPDALDALFRNPSSSGTVEFSMAGCRVTIHADDRVVVFPPGPGVATSIDSRARP